MNGLSRIDSTNVNPAFKANYNVFKIKLKMKQLTCPLYTRTEKIIAKLEGKRTAEALMDQNVSNSTLAETIKDLWSRQDYYVLEGFNEQLGKIAAEVYKLV